MYIKAPFLHYQVTANSRIPFPFALRVTMSDSEESSLSPRTVKPDFRPYQQGQPQRVYKLSGCHGISDKEIFDIGAVWHSTCFAG